MSQCININSDLDALKIKEIEKSFYRNIQEDVHIVPKVTPFKGINTDMLYIKDGRVLFIKFMDTTEDLFFLLEDELIEVMKEEYNFLNENMNKIRNRIDYNYVFVMPYITLDEEEEYDEFVENNIIDKSKLDLMFNYEMSIDEYLSNSNDEILLNLFLMNICPEYYVINNNLSLNKKLKKISFTSEDYNYTATALEHKQIDYIAQGI